MDWYVSYDEMKKHLAERQAHHTARAEHYTQEMLKAEKDLEGQLDEANTVTDRMHIKVSNSYTGATNERDGARESARSHARLSVVFEWKAKHIPAEMGFKISTHDAVELELVNGDRF